MATRRPHIVIAGTGRAGTTFLVELLTHLGMDTGFTPQELATLKDPTARAGLEHVEGPDAWPCIVKDPNFYSYAPAVFAREDLVVERVIIPQRDLQEAAESRRRVQRERLQSLPWWRRLQYRLRPYELAGGLVGTTSLQPGLQEAILEKQLDTLLHHCEVAQVPITQLQFPRLVQEPDYLYQQLAPILGEISFVDFNATFARVAKPEWVHP